MKRAFLVVWACVCAAVASAQFYATYPYVEVGSTELISLDRLFLFNGITLSTEIRYTGTESDVEWTDFDGNFVANTPEFSPEDGEGYILKIGGRDSLWIWVIDYAKYPLTISKVEVVEAEDKCDFIKIVPEFSAPDLIYKDKNGATHRLPRALTLTYDAVSFSGDAWTEPMPQTYKQITPFTEIVLEAPLCNTQFTLSGDDWGQKLGVTQSVAISELYQAIAVEAHLKATIEERAGKNERDRSGSDISGSGPLVVFFESRANPIDGIYYDWRIYPQGNPSNYTHYSDKDLRYTFNESGDYRVLLTVISSGGCEYTDSIDVKVLESQLEVPNVFTPNGDGKNDEFRVAYRSLKSYSCYVYNRWGRQVFHSTDPAKGWDGTINGKEAAQGAYYYVIQATGTDRDDNGDPITYFRSGDINLLRTKQQ